MKKITKRRTSKFFVELAILLLCVLGALVAYAERDTDAALRDPKIQWYLVAGIGALFVLNLVRLLILRRPVSSGFTVWTLFLAVIVWDVFVFYFRDMRCVYAVAGIFCLWMILLLTGKIVCPTIEQLARENTDLEGRRASDLAWQAEAREFLSSTTIKNTDEPDGIPVVAAFASRDSHKLFFYDAGGNDFAPGDLALYIGKDGQMHTVVVAIPSICRNVSMMTHSLDTLYRY